MSEKMINATSVANKNTNLLEGILNNNRPLRREDIILIACDASICSYVERKNAMPAIVNYVKKLYGKRKFRGIRIDEDGIYVMDYDDNISHLDLDIDQTLKEMRHD